MSETGSYPETYYQVQDLAGRHGKFDDKHTARFWLSHLAKALQREGFIVDWRTPDRFAAITRANGAVETIGYRVVKTPSPSTGEGRGGGVVCGGPA